MYKHNYIIIYKILYDRVRYIRCVVCARWLCKQRAHLEAVGDVVELAAEAAAFVHVANQLLRAPAVGRVLQQFNSARRITYTLSLS